MDSNSGSGFGSLPHRPETPDRHVYEIFSAVRATNLLVLNMHVNASAEMTSNVLVSPTTAKCRAPETEAPFAEAAGLSTSTPQAHKV